MSDRISIRSWLIAILIASALLRAALIWGGGQFYWLDEGRYQQSRALVAWATTGDTGDLFDRLNRADHVLFKFAGVIPAAIEHATSEDPRIPAAFFGAFSTLNIWLLWLVARRMGAADSEALAAAGLLAASVTFAYYARHVLPYDLAMTFGLLALHVGGRNGPRAADSLACGALAACAFLTYAGYWTLGAAVLLIHVSRAASWRDAARRALAAGAGLAAPIAAVLLVSAAFGGRLAESFVGFAQTINQGTYAEGWRLPFEYLWHAEHLLLLLWGAAVAAALARMRAGGLSPRARAGLLGLAVIYGAFVLAAALEQFVVYGRLARQLVPFFCLVAAAEGERLRRAAAAGGRGRVLVPALALGVLAQMAVNIRVPLQQEFPLEFLDRHAALAERGPGDRRWVYAHPIYPVPEPVALPPGHAVLAEARHPLQFRPYQYEGYTPAERQALRETDIRMRLVAVEPAGAPQP